MIIGVDYASIDRNLAPDWTLYRGACQHAGSAAGFAIFRAAWGVAPDDTVERDWKRAQEAGLVTGAYLFLRMRPEISPEDQVHVYAETVGALTAKDLPPVIDVEDVGLPAELELEYIHRAWEAMRGIYGTPPIVYTSARVWHEDLADLPAGEMTDSPLWVAKPWPWSERTVGRLTASLFTVGQYEPVVPKPWGWGNWWMHQYQGDAVMVPGFNRTVDLSRFHVLQQGEIGIRVAWVQRRLGMPVTRTFDASMAAAVRGFQASQGLVTDAIIGPRTFAPIAWTAPAVPTAA